MESNSYASYQGMMAKVVSALSGMESICGTLEMAETRKALSNSREKLESHHFAVGIMGEFKRGKSTVINSLLEQEIMPADILPCSATMNRVTYGMQPNVELKMIDGFVRNIAVEELSDYVTKLTSENESRAAEVAEAVVYYPCRFCQNGVDIVDTPGLNDDERMNRISEEVIPKLDAVIMVIVPGSPFSISEAEFVRNKLMTSDLSRLIFLVNKIDTIRLPEQRVKIVEEIKRKIRETVLEKMAVMYGKDSRQYQDAEMKLGDIRIFPFSALDALEGKQAGDQAKIDASGTREFEDRLTKMLTEERGALELGTPINVLQKASIEVKNTIDSRRNALSMSTTEFEEKQKEALKKLQELRSQKKDEEHRLKERSKEVQIDLSNRVAHFYPELEQRMLAVVAGYNPDPKLFSTVSGQESGAAKLQGLVVDETKSAISEFTEKVIVELQDIIEAEAVSSAKFTETISNQIDGILTNVVGKKGILDSTDLIATGIDIVTDFAGIYGIGGVVAGYRAAGFKGAAVGGGLGLAANLAVAGILTSMSIVGLPLVVVSCAVGTIVSKKMTQTIFKKDIGDKKLKEIKGQMELNIIKAVKEMQFNRDLENWVDKLVVDRFDELIAAMDEECEKMLRDTESSMNEIRKDLVQSETERAQTMKRLDEAEVRCVKILTELKPVCEKVQAALKEGA